MNPTIAVALITTASALGGVVLTGTITLLANRMQVRGQHEITEMNLRDQNTKDRRQIRREVYVQFLNQAALINNRLEAIWNEERQSVTDSFAEFFSPLHKEIDSLLPYLNLVHLEGPRDVSHAAQDVLTKLKVSLNASGFKAKRLGLVLVPVALRDFCWSLAC